MPTKKVTAPSIATTKKPVAKAIPKKITATIKSPLKTSAKSVSTAKKTLVHADNNTSFWVADGQILNNLIALRDALASMDKTVYKQHASNNDFAKWVSAILKDVDCAKELKEAKTPATAKAVVVRHLKLYKL